MNKPGLPRQSARAEVTKASRFSIKLFLLPRRQLYMRSSKQENWRITWALRFRLLLRTWFLILFLSTGLP